MNVEVKGELIKVTMSRRNLQTLLFKLDEPSSKRTLLKQVDGGMLVVQAEEDADHYGYKHPGVVHPREEAKLNVVNWKKRYLQACDDADIYKLLTKNLMRRLADAGEMLWVVLANVNDGDWKKQSVDWQNHAAHWRDDFHKVLHDVRRFIDEG